MRRALAAAVLGISLWLGSLAWTGFVLLRTVLDPERSRDVAEALYDDETVRGQIAAGISASVSAALPPGVSVPDEVIEATTAEVLRSPAVEAVFVDALARTHTAFLGEGEVPDAVDPGAFGAAAREAIVTRNPELDPFLPAAPELAVSLPTERVPDLGPVRDALERAVPLLALASAAGVGVALLVTSNRPAVVRRAGIWAIGLSATVLVVAYGIPAVAEALLPAQAAVITALIGAMAEATRLPALVLGGTGVTAVVLASLWRHAPRPVPADVRGRRPGNGRPVRPHRRDLPRPARPAPPPARRAPPPMPRVHRGGPVDRTTVLPPAATPPVQRSAPPSGGTGGSDDATRVDGTPMPGSRWVEGVGWVLESAEAIPSDARWVPGVGYVVER